MITMYFAQSNPESWTDLVWLPAILTFFGGLMYFLGALKERDGGKAPSKWIGVGLCGLGAIVAFSPFWTYVSSSPESVIYREINNGRKMMFGHVGGFLLPVVIVLACLGHHFYTRWRNRVFED